MSDRPQIREPFLWALGIAVAAIVLAHFPLGYSIVLATASGLGLVHLTEADRIGTAKRVREALSILQIPVSTAAKHYMDMDFRAFERALAGEQKLDLWRLAMLGPEFRRVYALLELRDLGLPQMVNTWLRIEPVLTAMKERA